MLPVSWLSSRRRTLKFRNCPNSVGMGPIQTSLTNKCSNWLDLWKNLIKKNAKVGPCSDLSICCKTGTNSANVRTFQSVGMGPVTQKLNQKVFYEFMNGSIPSILAEMPTCECVRVKINFFHFRQFAKFSWDWPCNIFSN
jgi:hypothetical protein